MKKIGLSILALILIAGIIYAGYFFLEEKRVKDYSTACMDKVREEIGNEYLGNIALIDSEKVDGVYHYFGTCSDETSDYYFSCAVTNKDNVDVKIEVDEIPDDFDGCNRYFDGCNRCTMQDDGEIICTEEACEEYQEAYCADEPAVKEVNSEIDNTGWDWVYKEGEYTFRERRARTGNISDYKNEEYGFQLLLPEARNDCIIDEYQTLDNRTANIDRQNFELICPSTSLNPYNGHEYLNDDVIGYTPEGYYLIGSIVIGSESTAEWVEMDRIPDEHSFINNKYKIRIDGANVESSITKQGKILFSDLECGKYPYCECEEQMKDYYDDNYPDPYQDPSCFVYNFIKDHLEVFDAVE